MAWTFNPFTGKLDATLSQAELDSKTGITFETVSKNLFTI